MFFRILKKYEWVLHFDYFVIVMLIINYKLFHIYIWNSGNDKFWYLAFSRNMKRVNLGVRAEVLAE